MTHARIVSRIGEIEPGVWDSVVSKAAMKHDALAAYHDVLVGEALYALACDDAGPYAAIAARLDADWPVLRRVLAVSPHHGRLGGIQLRAGLSLEHALPRLVPTLAAMARRRRCVAFAVVVSEEERAAYASHGFVSFEVAASNLGDLSGVESYEALLRALPQRARAEVKRARRRSEEYGIRFEMTSPPRANERALFDLAASVFAAHGERIPFTANFFERMWASHFAEHLFFAGYLGERIVTGLWCYRDGDVLTVAVPAIDYEHARPSCAYLTTLDEILRWSLSNGIRRIEWGTSNDAIKARYGAARVRTFDAMRPALPLAEPMWKGMRSLLRSPLVGRALGVVAV